MLKDSIYSKIINRFIYLNLENRGEKNYEYILGYKTFGIILYGFALWLKEALNKENIKKVYFLSRDGWILKKAFNLINGNDKFDTRYLFASRRSLIVPCIWMCKDYDDTKILLNIPSRITKEKFLKNVGLDSHISVISATELKEVLDEEKQKELYECLKHIIITNSKKEYYSIKKYLEQQQFYGRLAIVDIGWAGRMQNALYNLTLDKDIFGFYVGTRKFKEIDKLDYIKRTGYLFNRNINNNSIYLGAMNALFETFFLGNHGSVKNFEIDATGKIKVNLYEYEYKNAPEQKDVIKKFQLGALNFVEDLNKSVLKKWITIENNLVCNNMVKTFLNPTIRTCKLFGDIVFLDHFHTYIARPNDWSFYIKHPNKIYSDLKQSTWKIAFISRLTNIYSSLWFYLYYCLKKYCKKE